MGSGGTRPALAEVIAQDFAAAGMAQFAQGLGFDLTNTFACDIKLLTHFFERVIGIHVDTKTHTQHLGFTSGEAVQHIQGCWYRRT